MARRPKREVVTHPRTRAARPGPHHTVAREVREQTPLGEVYLRALMRSQLRLGVAVAAGVCVLLGSLPLVFALWPEAGLWGLSLPWLVLGVPAHLLLVASGALYVRRAERNERAFAELVDHS
ncbi:hypothetical protein [Streptomyces sp. TR06-5]|uniref:hypothetical protein n=1 Tax=unclassified Streptomyces TaxID=2593676 RepID=UPI0039A3B833